MCGYDVLLHFDLCWVLSFVLGVVVLCVFRVFGVGLCLVLLHCGVVDALVCL